MPKTVFVTGASGFIARHVVLELLRQGYAVRGSVRNASRGAHVRASMERHLGEAYNADRLDFVDLDLTQDAGWHTAMDGADALMHTASPVPMSQPKNEMELIEPAVQGTLRALRAARAASVSRVILTSSVAAISGEVPTEPEVHYDESDWTDLSNPHLSPYAKSKTLAEQAAWDFANENKDLKLSTINPAFVFGPALDEDFGASLGVIKRVMKGRDPMLPRVSFSVVDVRDVAALHVAMLEQDSTIGQRCIASAGALWFLEMADILRAEHPDLKIAKRVAPNWLLRLLALRDKPLRFILPALGRRSIYDRKRFHATLGRDPISAADAVRATGRFLVEGGHL